ncbi:hypothetical protein [Hymenobacter sp. YC55]|uniref:hypothetical protein n=1 Tax=Hymenobacter sp. YC55 TaxID=3034019 RepID=UPI0023F6B78C|nr:hypothetical protein [Hymenobacter sp. YC55]MDF7809927.1 hypothetical protein [Hymenobacter sp. YC55]
MSTATESTNSFTIVYPQLADRLAEQLPGLWIDLDQDQLEQPTEDYPLPYDSGVVLISFDEIDWQDLGQGVQRGEAVIRFTLAIQVVQDSYQHSAQRAAAMAKLQLLGDMHRALQHFAGDGFGALVRTYSRKEAQTQPGLWVYSQGYKCRLDDAAGYDGGTDEATDLDTVPEGRFVIDLLNVPPTY